MKVNEQNSGLRWTEEEEKKLIRYALTNCKLSDIANNLGRTPSAVAAKLETIAINSQKFEQARTIIKQTFRLEDL